MRVCKECLTQLQAEERGLALPQLLDCIAESLDERAENRKVEISTAIELIDRSLQFQEEQRGYYTAIMDNPDEVFSCI